MNTSVIFISLSPTFYLIWILIYYNTILFISLQNLCIYYVYSNFINKLKELKIHAYFGFNVNILAAVVQELTLSVGYILYFTQHKNLLFLWLNLTHVIISWMLSRCRHILICSCKNVLYQNFGYNLLSYKQFVKQTWFDYQVMLNGVRKAYLCWGL